MFDIIKPVKNSKPLGNFDVFVQIKLVMIEYPPTRQNPFLQICNLSKNHVKIFKNWDIRGESISASCKSNQVIFWLG